MCGQLQVRRLQLQQPCETAGSDKMSQSEGKAFDLHFSCRPSVLSATRVSTCVKKANRKFASGSPRAPRSPDSNEV
jgi:hypothetical protein